jgi:hypothetical protein
VAESLGLACEQTTVDCASVVAVWILQHTSLSVAFKFSLCKGLRSCIGQVHQSIQACCDSCWQQFHNKLYMQPEQPNNSLPGLRLLTVTSCDWVVRQLTAGPSTCSLC